MRGDMDTTIKAIETQYKGYRFRSRLEARWAVFFDALGVKWEYEKEGYDLADAGWYLPDFWLPELNVFFEVKPTFGAVRESHAKSVALSYTKAPIIVTYDTSFSAYNWFGMAYISPDLYLTSWVYTDHAFFILVGDIDGTKQGNYFLWGGGHSIFSVGSGLSSRDSFDGIMHKERVLAAFTAARTARFEHGESGSPKSSRE